MALSLLINSLEKEPLIIAKNWSSRGKSLREIKEQLVNKYDNGDTGKSAWSNCPLINDAFESVSSGDARILGINWNIDNDTPGVKLLMFNEFNEITKHGLLSIIGQFFDPIWVVLLRIVTGNFFPFCWMCDFYCLPIR